MNAAEKEQTCRRRAPLAGSPSLREFAENLHAGRLDVDAGRRLRRRLRLVDDAVRMMMVMGLLRHRWRRSQRGGEGERAEAELDDARGSVIHLFSSI